MSLQIEIEKLVDKGLVHKKEQGGFTIYKYKNRVFYNNLWHLSDTLLECRGIVFDKDGSVVQRPFKKMFNHGENQTFVDPDRMYGIARKVNGFMVAATMHKGELIVSTTGSLTSGYAALARQWVQKDNDLMSYLEYSPDLTFLLECCDPSDPHIIDEEYGLHRLGVRDKATGKTELLITSFMQGSEVLNEVKKVHHEGFVLTDGSREPMVKIKSPHYLSKKALMRFSKKKMKAILKSPEAFKQNLDEEFYSLFDHIAVDIGWERFYNLTEANRKKLIEEYFNG